MNANVPTNRSRRTFLRAVAAVLALAGSPFPVIAGKADERALRIGIIGAGRIGGTLGPGKRRSSAMPF